MNQLDFSSLQNAITSLSEGIAVVNNTSWFYAQSSAVQNTLIAGVIQNFEFVYELSVKMLKRQLELEAFSPIEIDQADYKELLRTAAEKGFIDNVEAWFEYRRMRNITAHTHDTKKVYLETLIFLEDAKKLLQQLSHRHV